MFRTASKLLPVFAAALALAGCGGNVDFSISKTFAVDSATASGRAQPAQVDLAAEAGSAWKERKHIDKITINSVTAEVLTVTAGNGLAMSGTAWVHEPGVTDENLWIRLGPAAGTFTVGEVLDLPISPALNTFLLTQLRNDGVFVVEAEGTSDAGRITGTVRVTLDATLKWKAF
jgi:hypothetical protein